MVNKSNRNEFTIRPLSGDRESFSTTVNTMLPSLPNGQCTSYNNADISCYYHDRETQTMISGSSMPPILVVGIQLILIINIEMYPLKKVLD